MRITASCFSLRFFVMCLAKVLFVSSFESTDKLLVSATKSKSLFSITSNTQNSNKFSRWHWSRSKAWIGSQFAGGIEAIRRGHKSPFYSIDHSRLCCIFFSSFSASSRCIGQPYSKHNNAINALFGIHGRIMAIVAHSLARIKRESSKTFLGLLFAQPFITYRARAQATSV